MEKKNLDSGDALVGVDGEESWDIPSFREERICGNFVTCDFPNSDGVGHDVIFWVLVLFPVVNCSGCKLVVVDVLLLVLRGVSGFKDSVHVWGEDNAVWIAEDSRVGHFVVDGGASVSGVAWLGPIDFFPFVAHASGEEDVGVARSAIVVKLWGLAIFSSSCAAVLWFLIFL